MNAVKKMAYILEYLCEEAKGSLTIQLLDENHQAVIDFQENGAGISSEMQKRMFEPFFTIRRENKDTGLVLAISQKIVKEHGGEIEVPYKESKQTAIILYFPPGIRKISPLKLKKVRSTYYVKKIYQILLFVFNNFKNKEKGGSKWGI